jgi:C1A family cysteine protease
MMDYVTKSFGMGWLPDYPDHRDYTVEQNKVSDSMKRLGQKTSVKAMLSEAGAGVPVKSLPSSADLRPWCSPVEDQGNIGSCTAHAAVGILEYFERRAFGKHIDASRLFLYKVTRNMLNMKGDTGAFLRSTMGALVLLGVPPEEYWPYVPEEYDKEPSAFCYAFAQNYQAISYYRLDPLGTSKAALLKQIKTNITAGLPSMFGFTVFSSVVQAEKNGMIPFPVNGEKVMGGHAVAVFGYDDTVKVKNANPGSVETKGALLVRNSWGAGWGNGGYGWLPYDYVTRGLATDWWSLLKNEWIDTGEFKV